MEVIIKGVDQLSPVMDKIATKSNASIESMKKKFKEAEGSLLAVGATMTVFGAAVIAANLKFLKMASDAAETSSKFAVVFQSVSKEAEAMAKDLSRNFGLSSTAAKQLLGDTGDLLTGFGFSGKAALDLSGEVNKLAVDLASFTNFSGGAAGASAALTKALLGERESVKSLGISILEEDVAAKVALITKQGMIFETERQAKAYATLLIAQEQSKNAIGDYQRTQDQFANKSRELTARLTDLAIVFGEKLLPMATRGISIITGLVEKITDWTERHPILTDILVKFGLALGLLVGSGGLLILGSVAFVKIAGAIKITKDVLILFSTVLKTSLIPSILATAKAVWAFTASILANPLTFWIGAIGLAITAIVLLFKNWEKVTEFISRSIDWIGEKIKWLGDAFKWVAEKLGIYKEKTTEIIEGTDDLKEKVDETKTAIDDLAIAETEAETAARLLKEENIKLAASIEDAGVAAAEATEGMTGYADAATENYINLASKATDSWEDFYAFWEAEAKRTAENIIAINKEVETSTPKPKPSNLYKIVDAEGNPLGLQSGNILSQAQKEAGIKLIKLHTGEWKVKTAIPGGEGIALLKDNEVISQEGTAKWKGATNQIRLEIKAGAFNITTNKLDEGTIKKAGKWLFDEFYSQCRANNIVLQRG